MQFFLYSIFYSSHPYLFFNEDHETVTFFGFNVDCSGNLIDPDHSNTVIKKNIMSRNLYFNLNNQMKSMRNKSEWESLNTNYNRLTRLKFFLDTLFFV